jgi:hypothetical protein
MMPRKAKFDAVRALHHIICRGIEPGKIFKAVAARLGIPKPAVSRLAQREEKLAAAQTDPRRPARTFY